MRRLDLALAAALVWAAPAFGRDCPDFGVQSDQQDAFCDAFEDLLYAPHRGHGDRSVTPEERRKFDWILESDPLWAEVYRSDPKSTLQLIARIRDAGGLRR